MRQIDFEGAAHPDLTVEAIEVPTLIERIGEAGLGEVQRLSFGVMLIVRGGTGSQVVDFESIELRAGRVVFARPGQVLQWVDLAALDAVVVVARPELCGLDSWFPGQAAYRDLESDAMATAADLARCVQREQEQFSADEASVRLLDSLFASLTAVFDRAEGRSRSTPLPEPYVLFRTVLEADFTRSRDARVYMNEIGFSERTINRACQRATGFTAKGVVDQRIVLEAHRLLALTDLPINAIARQLGFTEAANFDKYIARLTGARPLEFRARLRARSASAVADAGFSPLSTFDASTSGLHLGR